MSSLALFGGTYDPVHFGHLIAARTVREQLGLDRILFIPSARPPHKGTEPPTAIHHRLNMVRLAIDKEENFDCDDCETRRPGPSYTYDTVMQFRTREGVTRLCWLIGADSLGELESWYRVADLVDACEIITVSRPGWEAPDLQPLRQRLSEAQIAKLRRGIVNTPRIDIASRDIRARVVAGLPIRYLTPDTVCDYITAHNLYRT